MQELPSNTYRIPEQNVEKLLTELNKLSRRAAKLNSGAITVYVEPQTETETHTDAYGVERVQLYNFITVQGPAPKIDGWTFVATLEHTEAGTIVRAVPGLTEEGELKLLRNATVQCNHCGLKRVRTDTFILRSDAHEYKQVGRNCLKDFLGHASPETVAQMAEYLMLAGDLCGAGAEDGYGGYVEHPLSILAFLTVVAAIIRRIGYVSRSKAEEWEKTSTSHVVGYVLEDNQKHGVHTDKQWCGWRGSQGQDCSWNAVGGHIGTTDEDVAKATAALAWIRGQQSEGMNDYLYNLWVACQDERVPRRHYGIVASLLATYQREVEKDTERAEAVKTPGVNEWVGEVGQRQVLTGLTVHKKRAIESHFGVTMLHTFLDNQGRMYKWFSSSGEYAERESLNLVGTIKAHEVYKDRKITTLTRVKPYTEPVAKSRGKGK